MPVQRDKRGETRKFNARKSSQPDAVNSNEIAALAFSLWEARGCPEGSPEVDWFQAEQQLTTAANGNSQKEKEPLLARQTGA